MGDGGLGARPQPAGTCLPVPLTLRLSSAPPPSPGPRGSGRPIGLPPPRRTQGPGPFAPPKPRTRRGEGRRGHQRRLCGPQARVGTPRFPPSPAARAAHRGAQAVRRGRVQGAEAASGPRREPGCSAARQGRPRAAGVLARAAGRSPGEPGRGVPPAVRSSSGRGRRTGASQRVPEKGQRKSRACSGQSGSAAAPLPFFKKLFILK